MKLNKTALLISTTALTMVRAFNNEGGWKKDENGNLVVDSNGNPIFVSEDGEQSVNSNSISRLGRESKQHRERAEAAEAKLAKYEGIEDPDAARAALETVSALDSNQLLSAEQLETAKQQYRQQVDAEIATIQSKLAESEDRYNNLLLDNAFAQSTFLKDNLAVPVDLIRAAYQNSFKVENGNVIAVDKDGNPLQSKKEFGANATFDEALELFISSRPDKDALLRAPQFSGSGNTGEGGNRGQTTGKYVRRSEFDQMSPAEQSAVARNPDVKIVD